MSKQACKNSNKMLDVLIAESWDRNVNVRAEDIEKKTDYTYHKVILPWVLNKVSRYTSHDSRILDIGCGCGYLTNEVFETGRRAIQGIDLSYASVEYASRKYPEICFKNQNVYDLENCGDLDACLAIMLLNNIPEIDGFFKRMAQILKPGGYLLACIPHPCFWPHKHILENSFRYDIIEKYIIPFSTKGRKDYRSPVPYFHRPLEVYVASIQDAGFSFVDFEELVEGEMDKNPDILSLVLRKEAI